MRHAHHAKPAPHNVCHPEHAHQPLHWAMPIHSIQNIHRERQTDVHAITQEETDVHAITQEGWVGCSHMTHTHGTHTHRALAGLLTCQIRRRSQTSRSTPAHIRPPLKTVMRVQRSSATCDACKQCRAQGFTGVR